MRNITISLIITTYNWPTALNVIFHSILQQNFPFAQLEIIIADDGSTEETRALIEEWQSKFECPLLHVWHEDRGFRAAKIRNLAAKAACHDYMIFLDGDCILGANFLKEHAALAEPNWFVAGNRVLLSEDFSKQVLMGVPAYTYDWWQWMRAWKQGKINRFFPTFRLPLLALRKIAKRRWQGAKTCNFAVWREDFFAVNGLDEIYEGWGFEDSDLAVRLINNDIYKKMGQCSVPVYHLHHKEASRQLAKSNYEALQHTILSHRTWANKGLNQYRK